MKDPFETIRALEHHIGSWAPTDARWRQVYFSLRDEIAREKLSEFIPMHFPKLLAQPRRSERKADKMEVVNA